MVRRRVHDSDEPCIAEALLDRLIPALVRAGSVSADTLLELADALDREAANASIERETELTRMATALRVWAIDATGQTQAEWEAERRRKRMNIVPLDR